MHPAFEARPRLWRLFAVAAALLGLLGLIAALGLQVTPRIQELDTAEADNVEWTLSRAETELQTLHVAIHETVLEGRHDFGDLEDVRRRFDVFYSRVTTLTQGDAYRHLRADPEFDGLLRRLKRGLDASVAAIDGDDDALRAALPGLETQAAVMAQSVRRLGVIGLGAEAARARALRERVSDTLALLALVTCALVGALAAMTAALWRSKDAMTARAAEAAATAARLDAILRSSLDAIIVTDRDGRLLDLNDVAVEMFGYSPEEAIGETVDDLMTPPNLVPANRKGREIWQGGEETRIIDKRPMESYGRDKTGRVFPVELSIRSAQAGGEDLLIAFIRDISARRAWQEALIEARDRAVAGEKARADFVAVMSHEIRTPLNGILGALALMRDARTEEERDDLRRMMETSGRILMQHVNDVLDISRMDSGRLELRPRATDLPALMRESLDSQVAQAERRRDRLSMRWIGPHPPRLMLDGPRLRQVLLNLLSNAVKFTENGEVTLEGEILGRGEDAMLELRVIDTGAGIAEADLARVFEDFETLDRSRARWRRGTGLGLGISRRIVEAMKGAIHVVSEPGEGSIFTVTLPVRAAIPAADTPKAAAQSAAAAATPLAATPPAAPPAATGTATGAAPGPSGGIAAARADAPRVLVVEDNSINRAVLRGMLMRRGAEVDEAGDGVEGVVMAGARAYDLVLLDIGMPRMDGFEAARRIRSGGGPSAHAPIHAVTADVTVEAGGPGDAVDSVLTKPVAAESLDALLRNLPGALLQDGEAGTAGERRPAPAGGKAAGAGAGGDGALSPARFENMQAELGQGPALELAIRFLAEGDRVVPTLGALAARDGAAAAQAAHRLAGGAASFGAMALHQRLSKLERAARDGDQDGVQAAARGAAEAWAICRAALEATATATAENPERVGGA
ncbi:hybrid sensor histidine kinase/response regulator [Rhodovulum sp. DZ06]|uniref:hybrid sensor histidine kinase/response regulator n=1 Tax=Rhodovulum sp. DZ06 TaxID=3425126 RepID=UPI003D3336EF